MSGLNVNFHKSSLVGVNANYWLQEVVSVMNRRVWRLPFLYLDPPIEGCTTIEILGFVA